MKTKNNSKIHILLIEDNSDHAELIIRSLSRSLPKALFKHSLKHQECLGLIKKKKYDLILMDFYLSGAPTLQLLQTLKKLNPEIPIIIITGQGDERTAAKSIKAGAEEYVEKTRESLEKLPNIILNILEKNKDKQKKTKKKKTQPSKSTPHLKGVFKEFEHISTSLKSLYKRLNGAPPSPKSKKGELKKIPLLEKKVTGLKSLMQKLFMSE